MKKGRMILARAHKLTCYVLVCIAVIVSTALPAFAQTGTRVTTFLHHDGLGSVVAATDESGNLLWRKSYQPYGKQTSESDTTEKVSYTGHTYDGDLGLTYMKARYYDPDVGRFMGIDPVGVIGSVEQNPMMFNRYAYGNNNPYKYVDPDGGFVVLAITAAVIAYSAYEGYQSGGASGAVAEASGYNDAVDSYNSVKSGDYTGAAIGAAGILCKACKAVNKVTKSGVKELTDAAGGTVKSAKKGDIRAPGGREKAKELFREHDTAGVGNRKIVRERDGSRAVVGELEDGTSMRIRFKKNETTRIQAGKQKIQFND